MGRNKIRWFFVSLTMSIIVRTILPQAAAGSSPGAINVGYRDMDAALAARIDGVLPQGLSMVDEAIDVLSRGKSELSSTQWMLFERYFDPAGTGEIDEEFVSVVLENFGRMQDEFEAGLTVEYETEHEMCRGMRLYYTDFFKVHVCPYIHTETDDDRLARHFVHELAHIALVSMDRAYYSETSSRYAKLTPHGHWAARVPVIGRIVREIVRQDTLYNPDAYSEFAYELMVLDAGAVAVNEAPETADHELDAAALAGAAAADRSLLSLSRMTNR
jgi:hypothetical protein